MYVIVCAFFNGSDVTVCDFITERDVIVYAFINSYHFRSDTKVCGILTGSNEKVGATNTGSEHQ